MSTKISQWSPITLFIYKRPEHARRTIASLKACLGYEESPLYVFADGPAATYNTHGAQGVEDCIPFCRSDPHQAGDDDASGIFWACRLGRQPCSASGGRLARVNAGGAMMTYPRVEHGSGSVGSVQAGPLPSGEDVRSRARNTSIGHRSVERWG